MDLKEYLKRRESRTFTRRQVEYLLRKCGYQYKLIDTLVKPGKSTWKESGYKSEEVAQKEIHDTYKGEIPYHFAYIKFYKVKNRKGPYALVAGKTNLGAPDFSFEVVKSKKGKLIIAEMGKNKAKAFVGEKDIDRKWLTHEVLAVWQEGQALDRIKGENKKFGSQARRAETVEVDIGGLFGLFDS